MADLVRASGRWRPRVDGAASARVAPAIVLVLLASSLHGQTKPVTISVKDYRPMRAAVVRIRELSGVPVSYEDVRCDFPADQLDVTEGSFTPEQIQMSVRNGNGPPKFVVPRGGSLSFMFAADSSTGRLADLTSTKAALQSALAAYNSSGLPGKFGLEIYDGQLIIAPIEERDGKGTAVPVASVLSAPVMLPPIEESAMEQVVQILDAVKQGTGYRVGVGAVPVNGMAMTRAQLGENTEPASHLLIRILNLVMGYASTPPAGGVTLSYDVLYDVQLKYYMFNATETGRQNIALPTAPVTPPVGVGRPGIRPQNR